MSRKTRYTSRLTALGALTALGTLAAALVSRGLLAQSDASIGDVDANESLRAAAAALPAGLTPHFQAWLSANGYDSSDFVRADVPGGSYGGRTSDADTPVNQPVIFVHGNSDSALGTGSAAFTGWSKVIPEFLSRGYRTSEVYATTWGPANPLLASQQYHSRAHLTRLRAFVEAVLAYTGASRVDIVSHSMGVTLMRKVVKGGPASDLADGGSYNLGPSLTSRVDAFVGISGANWGLVSCYQTGPTTPTCGATNGEYPGYWYGPTGLSSILSDLNATSRYEGAFRFTIWSTLDEVIGYGDVVWGRYTSQIPSQSGEKRFGAVPYGHIGCKDLTAAAQFQMVTAHAGF